MMRLLRSGLTSGGPGKICCCNENTCSARLEFSPSPGRKEDGNVEMGVGAGVGVGVGREDLGRGALAVGAAQGAREPVELAGA
jgi:hypothetical protein